MDAKAKTTEAAGKEEASALDNGEATETKSAADTLEERLKAGLEEQEPDKPPKEEPEEKPPEEPEEKAEDDGGDKKHPEESGVEEGELTAEEMAGLSARAQKKVNERIHELNIRRKDAEAKTEQTEARLKDLEKKLQDEAILAAMKQGLDPDYITPEEAKTLKRFEQLRAMKRWCRTHRDGYEGSGDNEDPSWTAEKVAETEAEVEDELLEIGGDAQRLLRERTKQMRDDMAAGRKLRLEKAHAPAKSSKPDPKPPRLPDAAGATRKAPVSTAAKPKPEFDAKEFNEGGADKNALEKQYEKIFGSG